MVPTRLECVARNIKNQQQNKISLFVVIGKVFFIHTKKRGGCVLGKKISLHTGVNDHNYIHMGIIEYSYLKTAARRYIRPNKNAWNSGHPASKMLYLRR